MNNYGEIDLSSIAPGGMNPRKTFDADKLQSLADSIKARGVLEPIIVRRSKLWDKAQKTGAKAAVKQYEIVAGERRFKAAGMAGLKTIPAIVKDLTDAEVYDVMLIENIQRADLTDLEEAQSFRDYGLAHKGEDGILALAEKTGIRPAYIRSRIRVLELPANVLKAWGDGKVAFGHLQQLLRVAGDPKVLKEMAGRVLSTYDGDHQSVREIRRQVDNLAPALSGAFFPMKEACAGCGSSSIVQKELFDVDADKALCLNPACFKKRQNDYLSAHWKETSLAKTHGTNGFRFEDPGRYLDHHSFRYGPRPAEKCKACPMFITIIELDGTVETPQACVGKDECYTGATRAKQKLGDKPRDPEAPRASWHGIYFRDRFLRGRIEQELDKAMKAPTPELAQALCLFALIKQDFEARDAVVESMNVKDSAGVASLHPVDLEVLAEGSDPKAIRKHMIAAAKAVILSGQVEQGKVEHTCEVGGLGRVAIARFLGIDLAKEFAVDEDYLDKKTKAEILAFGKKFNLFAAAPAEAAALAKKMHLKPKAVLKDPATLKKSELVAVILAHGKDLVGKVPAEILAKAGK